MRSATILCVREAAAGTDGFAIVDIVVMTTRSEGLVFCPFAREVETGLVYDLQCRLPHHLADPAYGGKGGSRLARPRYSTYIHHSKHESREIVDTSLGAANVYLPGLRACASTGRREASLPLLCLRLAPPNGQPTDWLTVSDALPTSLGREGGTG